MRYIKFSSCICLLLLLLSGCTSERKGMRYKQLYQEKPTVVLIAKPLDLCKRMDEKQKEAALYNDELKNATLFFQQNLSNQLLKKGYFVSPLFVSEELILKTGYKDSFIPEDTVLSVFSEKYGIDAILFTTLYKWKDAEELWTVFVDYQLKSTKTNRILFQTKCKGIKFIPVNRKGLAYVAKSDKRLVRGLDYDDRTLNRIILLRKLNEYILKEIPNGKYHSKFEEDTQKPAGPKYIEYWIDELGEARIKLISLEQFEQECFLEN